MRYFIILALLMMPISMVLFHSTDTDLFASKASHEEILFEKDDVIKANHNSLTQVENEQANINIEPPLKPNKVKLVAGKKNTQGMQFLSVLLLLKEEH